MLAVPWLEEVAAGQADAAEDVDGQEPLAVQLEALRECRKALTPQQKRVLALFYDGGKSGHEVAALLGINRPDQTTQAARSMPCRQGR